MKRLLIPAFMTFLGFSVSGYAADPVDTCRSAVRHQVRRQYNSQAVDFSVNNLNDNGRRDWVSGTFYLARDRDRDTPYQFTCSVNGNGDVRRVSINPGYAETGSANRMMDTGQAGMNNCQNAVERRLRNDGYGPASFNSIRVDNSGGRNDFVTGSVMADNGRSREFFDFSCRVDPHDGDLRSVDVNRR